jgi:hypothetical protein
MAKFPHFAFRVLVLAFLVACTGTAVPAAETPTESSSSVVAPAPEFSDADGLNLVPRRNVGGCFSIQGIEGYPEEVQLPGVLFHDPAYNVLFYYVYFDADTPGRNPATDFLRYLDDFYFSIESDYVGLTFGEASPRAVDGHEGNSRMVNGKIDLLQDIGRFVTVTFEDGDQFMAMAWAASPAVHESWRVLGSEAFEAMLDSVRFGEDVGTEQACGVPAGPAA